MTAMRAVLVAITILVMAVAPLVVPSVTGSSGGQAAYAAPDESPSLNGNDNGNGNGNDNDDDGDNGNGNDNDDDNGNGNDNEDVPDPILVGQPGGTAVGTTGAARGLQSVTGVTKCFDVQEVGLVQRAIGEGDVTVAVPPDSGFTSVTRLTLDAVPTTSVPAPPGGTSVLDTLVFRVSALDGCAGAPIVQLSGGVNLGITYRVAADKSRLQIVTLQNDQWVNVTTVPDPNPTNPYISATIQSAGTYAVIQR